METVAASLAIDGSLWREVWRGSRWNVMVVLGGKNWSA